MPFVYKGAGLIAALRGGRIIGFERCADPNQALRGDIETKLLQRSQAALAGTFHSTRAWSAASRAATLLQGTLAQQLGPGYATSTPGMQALATQGQRAEELRYGARTGQLTLAEQLGLQREQASEARQSRQFANSAGPWVPQAARGRDLELFAGLGAGAGAGAAGARAAGADGAIQGESTGLTSISSGQLLMTGVGGA